MKMLRRLPFVPGRPERQTGSDAGLDPSLLDALLREASQRLGRQFRVTDQRASRTGCHIVWISSDEPYIARVTVWDPAEPRLRGNVTALSAVHAAPWLNARLAEQIPRVLVSGRVRERFYSVETCLPGAPAADVLRSGQDVTRVTRAATLFLIDLHVASRQDVVVDQTLWDDRFSPIIEQVGLLLGNHGGARGYSKVASYLQRELMNQALPLVFAHGNFWIGNVLCDPDGNLTGVIDWDGATERGLPGVDLLYFLVRTDSLTARTSFGEAVAGWLATDCRPAKESPLVDEYCRALSISMELVRPLFCFSWLEQVHLHVRYGTLALTNPRWLAKNVLSVVEAAARSA